MMMSNGDTPAEAQDTLVILKPDAFWRGLAPQIETRLRALGLQVVSECTLEQDRNLPVEKWQEFYFPAIGNRPPCLEGTSRYMAYGPVKVIQLRGPAAIQKVRQAVGATRPWQADKAPSEATSGQAPRRQTLPFGLNFNSPGTTNFSLT